MTLKCGHSFFCEKCIPAYTFIENELWPKVSIPFFKDVLVVPKNNCPICDLKERGKTKKLKKLFFKKEIVKNRENTNCDSLWNWKH